MPLDPRTAPSRETVLAYTLAQNGEGGKQMMADLKAAMEALSRDIYDDHHRIDTNKIVGAHYVREFFRRMETMPAMASNPEWIAIDRARQLAAAEQKLKEQGNGK